MTHKPHNQQIEPNLVPAPSADKLPPQEPQDTVVLVVDDQPLVLRTLTDILIRKRYQVLIASNGRQALEILDRQWVHVIITDHHMPGLTGTELLQTAAERYPCTVRIMLTGETGISTLLPAVNSGAIDQLLTKPWTPETILNCISSILQIHRLKLENALLSEALQHRNEELREFNQHLGERIEVKAKALIRAVHYDAVTGLPKRNLTVERLAQSLTYAQRVKQPVIVAMLRIDRLQIISNSLGYKACDELLCTFTDWLRSAIAESDLLAHLEGNVFAVVIHGDTASDKLTHLTQQLGERLRNPFTAGRRELHFTASVGVSQYPGDATGVDELLQAAGWALQSAKEAGGDCCRYYADQPNGSAQRSLSLEASLRNALRREEFILHYQPRVKTENGQVLGAEALVRWQNPQQGMVLPGGFIALLEQTGLINDLGRWVLTQACIALKRWQDDGHKHIHLSVNISPVQIATGHLFDSVAAAVRTSGVDLSQGQLELEITEGTLMLLDHSTLAALHKTHSLGVRIAIDDFGTGYSALSYLTRFPIDVLKIDRSFIAQISSDPMACQENGGGNELVQAIVNIAAGMRMSTVAEGIETYRQWEFMRSCQCDELQGFLFNKPVSEQHFLKLLETHQCLPAERGRIRTLLPAYS